MPSEPIDSDSDLYCSECGYNLRGLVGDPRRCPECGAFEPIEDGTVDEDILRQLLRNLEAIPAMCLGAVILVMLGLVCSLAVGSMVCLLPVLIPAVLVWPGLVYEFRRSCRHREGWAEALLTFHLYGLLGSLIAAVILVAWYMLLDKYLRNLGTPLERTMIALGTLAIMCLLAYLLILRRLYRCALAGIKPMQRQTAMELARKVRRKRVTQSEPKE